MNEEELNKYRLRLEGNKTLKRIDKIQKILLDRIYKNIIKYKKK